MTLDTARLQMSWKVVAQFGDQVPMFFYSRLFVAHPALRDMFPLSMEAQRDKLVTALGSVVSSVDDLPAVVPVLEQLGRDHRRFAVITDHYPQVGEALLATLAYFLGDDWTEELAADWTTAYGIVAKVMLDAAEVDGDSPPWYEGTVLDVERRTASVAVLNVIPSTPIPYRAGQSLATEIPSRPRMWRYYSPATLAGEDGTFELHVRAVGGGAVSTALVQSTRPGDVFRFGSPVGEDLTLGDADDLVLIAGGTGLAPMKAIIAEVAATGGRRVRLFWGGKRHFDLYDIPAMEHLTRQHGWLDVVGCVSAEDAGAVTEQGSAVDVALRYLDLTAREVYVCGSPAMVDGTLLALDAAGVPLGHVHRERFGSGAERLADEQRA
jgi:NAD(P)H-flavin reductase/hemoglobin-like flavoprotein